MHLTFIAQRIACQDSIKIINPIFNRFRTTESNVDGALAGSVTNVAIGVWKEKREVKLFCERKRIGLVFITMTLVVDGIDRNKTS
jgi:hypothetical protein